MYKNSVCCEIIKTCPLSCIHCSANSNMRAKEYISLSDMKLIIDRASEDGVDTFFISGGEPLLHPDIYDIVEFIKTKNIKPVIYSSGCIVTTDSHDIKPINEKIFKDLENRGLDAIVFSVFSLVDEIHNDKTKTINSLNTLRGTLLNAKNTFSNTSIELSFIPLQDTYQEITEIIKFGEQYNISKINILKLIHQGRAKYSGLENLSRDEEKTFLATLVEFNTQTQCSIEVSKLYDCDHYNGLQKSPYTAGENEYFIASNQEVLPGRRFRN